MTTCRCRKNTWLSSFINEFVNDYMSIVTNILEEKYGNTMNKEKIDQMRSYLGVCNVKKDIEPKQGKQRICTRDMAISPSTDASSTLRNARRA